MPRVLSIYKHRRSKLLHHILFYQYCVSNEQHPRPVNHSPITTKCRRIARTYRVGDIEGNLDNESFPCPAAGTMSDNSLQL